MLHSSEVRILRIRLICRACGAEGCVPSKQAAQWMSAHYQPEPIEALAEPLDQPGTAAWWPLKQGA